MKLYFSGIRGAFETEAAQRAGVTNWLADPIDFKHLPVGDTHNRVLDSGAYRAHKSNKTLNVQEYVDLAISMQTTGKCDWAIAPDVIDDVAGAMTKVNWKKTKQLMDEFYDNHGVYPKFYPVFQWSAPYSDLEYYAGISKVVCIGGIAGLMHHKDESTLKELLKICADFKNLHILGMNWCKAINALRDYKGSFDTSKFLAGKRRRFLIFQHSKNGSLCEAPVLHLKDWLGKERAKELHSNIKELCIISASNMIQFLA